MSRGTLIVSTVTVICITTVTTDVYSTLVASESEPELLPGFSAGLGDPLAFIYSSIQYCFVGVYLE